MDIRHTVQSEIIVEPPACFGVAERLWQGCPTVARTRGGRLYAGWYSGGLQEPSLLNYNLLVRSDDDGLTWSEPLLVINSVPDALLQSLDIQLWSDPGAQSRGNAADGDGWPYSADIHISLPPPEQDGDDCWSSKSSLSDECSDWCSDKEEDEACKRKCEFFKYFDIYKSEY